jgi:hypothetical protein
VILKCGHDVDPGNKFCTKCGLRAFFPIIVKCPNGHECICTHIYCGKCGEFVEDKPADPSDWFEKSKD